MEGLDPKLVEQRERWSSKPVLRTVYGDFHRRLLAQSRPGRLLDIGAGSGAFAGDEHEVVSLDVLPAPWIDVVADAHKLPFDDGSFDSIVMVDVLHHLQRPLTFLREAARVLASGGRLAMIEPGITPLSWPFYRFAHPEPVLMRVDPFADQQASTDDPWDSNQAIPTLAFFRKKNLSRLREAVPDLRIVARRRLSLLAYPLSGGYQAWSLIPTGAVKPLLRFEGALLPFIGGAMAFRVEVILERV